MPKEKKSFMEKLPFKSSPMELEMEAICDGSSLGWEDAPSSRWPSVAPASLEREPNRPSSGLKIHRMDLIAKMLEKTA